MIVYQPHTVLLIQRLIGRRHRPFFNKVLITHSPALRARIRGQKSEEPSLTRSAETSNDGAKESAKKRSKTTHTQTHTHTKQNTYTKKKYLPDYGSDSDGQDYPEWFELTNNLARYATEASEAHLGVVIFFFSFSCWNARVPFFRVEGKKGLRHLEVFGLIGF